MQIFGKNNLQVEQTALQDSLAATGRQQPSATGGGSQYQRRGSIMPGSSLLAAPGATGGGTPQIMVSEASVSDFKESFGINGSRRSSTASVGPVIIPVKLNALITILIIF